MKGMLAGKMRAEDEASFSSLCSKLSAFLLPLSLPARSFRSFTFNGSPTPHHITKHRQLVTVCI